jgi:hypothetical protein
MALDAHATETGGAWLGDAGLCLEGIASGTVNLHWTAARASALVLVLLAASPFTAPFAVCDITDGSQSDHPATRHLTHTGAVVRPAAKFTRQPIVLSIGITRLVTLWHQPDSERRPAARQRRAPARHLVLRL